MNRELKKIWKELNDILKALEKGTTVTAYLEKWALENKVQHIKQKCGNIIMYVPGTKGMENQQTIILQANMGLVRERNFHDYITTGYNHSVGIPMALAIITDPKIQHGPLECIFTIDKEMGLTGAMELKQEDFTGDILINLDGYQHFYVYNGCAGGMNTNAQLWYNLEPAPEGYTAIRITVKIWESGIIYNYSEIYDNVIKILVKLLLRSPFNFNLHDFQGGKRQDLIANYGEAIVFIQNEHIEEFQSYVQSLKKGFVQDCRSNLEITTEVSKVQPDTIINIKSQEKLLFALNACRHGVIERRKDDKDVKTSTNLAICQKRDGYFFIQTSQRSSEKPSLQNIAEMVKSVWKLTGAKVFCSDEYPIWTNSDSEILEIVERCYYGSMGEDCKIATSFGRLNECGIFKETKKDMDIISIGATLDRGIPNDNDFYYTDAVQKIFGLLCNILIRIPEPSEE